MGTIDTIRSVWQPRTKKKKKKHFQDPNGKFLLYSNIIWPQECRGHIPTHHDNHLSWYDASIDGRTCRWYCGKVKEQEGHFKVLERFFERCKMYKLRMNPLKCAFGVSTRKFLGILVHHKGISMDPAKAMAIATTKRPTTIKELKSFLERVSYIRRFLPGLASITSGLSKLLKNRNAFIWGAEQQNSFQELQ